MKFVKTILIYFRRKFYFIFFIYPRIFKYHFLSENRIQGKNKINQPVLALGKGKISAYEVNFGVYQSPLFYNTYQYIDARSKNSFIEIGAGTWINNNAMICAEKSSIKIGKNCLIGSNFTCMDSDFHSLNPRKRLSGDHKCLPVEINDNVFIGNNVTILKGVTVGRNSIIGSGSVVTSSIPENVIAAGIPAKTIRNIVK